MDFLGMGWPEILVVAIVAIIVLGPDKLPVYARKIGKYYRKFKKITTGVTKDFKSAILEDEDGESLTDSIDSIKESLKNDADDLRRSLQEDLDDVTDSVNKSASDAKDVLEATTREVNNTINDIDDIDAVAEEGVVVPTEPVKCVETYDPMAEFNKPNEE